MPKNLVDVSSFTDPIVVPVDADPANAASVEVGFQGLANRTRHLANRFDVNGQIVLPAPLQYTARLTAAELVPISGTWTRPDYTEAVGGSIAASAAWDITSLVPYVGSIVRVRVLVDPELARTVLDGRVQVALVSRSYGVSYAAPAITTTTEGALEDDDGTAALQWITVTPASPVAVSGKTWAIQVATGATGTGADKFHACAVEYSVPTITGA